MPFSAARRILPMSARVPRTTVRTNGSLNIRFGGMRMNSSHAAPKSSDKPWIITSALIFGPAFLYLISPSARKNTHAIHDDKHNFPGQEEHVEHTAHASAAVESELEPEPVLLKDDEGVEANIAKSLQQAEESDVPTETKSSSSAVSLEKASTPELETELKLESDPEETSEKSETSSDDKEPKDLSEARAAAKEGATSKKAEESS